MPLFNVHLYRPYRVKFGPIEAETPEAAVEAVLTKPDDHECLEIDPDDGTITDALVDPIDADGEMLDDDGINFDMTPQQDGTYLIEPMQVPRRLEMPRINERELAALLAGLRLLQTMVHIEGHNTLPPAIDEIFQDGGTLDSLNPLEIDVLCERLNGGA